MCMAMHTIHLLSNTLLSYTQHELHVHVCLDIQYAISMYKHIFIYFISLVFNAVLETIHL